MNAVCDYLVVGAGSGGCVVANRLSASGVHKVILLEAGGRDTNPWLHIPIGYAKVHLRPQFNWLYPTEPEAELNQRSTTIPRGKVLGGSSAVNGLVYIRGQKEDYDNWLELGNEGWGSKDVLPMLTRAPLGSWSSLTLASGLTRSARPQRSHWRTTLRAWTWTYWTGLLACPSARPRASASR